MTETLELRNLFATYEKVNTGSKNEVYYNSHMNNYIVFSPYDDCDTESICNGISPEAYAYLTKVLNTTRNVIVNWSQVEGTTSDYNIYIGAALDVQKPTYKNIMELLQKKRTRWNSMKYNLVIDGQLIPITREEMVEVWRNDIH